jgi:hypothetical protein
MVPPRPARSPGLAVGWAHVGVQIDPGVRAPSMWATSREPHGRGGVRFASCCADLDSDDAPAAGRPGRLPISDPCGLARPSGSELVSIRWEPGQGGCHNDLCKWCRRVLAKLSPEGEVSDPERALYGVTHLAISGDGEGATLDQFIPEGDCPPVEHALTALEAPAARR